ncbi:MAG: MOSC N-terminal beta barrel domain-containing protein [Saprospiraceae bacterium]
MHTITDIIIYPIKGLGGIRLPEAFAMKAGFQHDRRWMLIDGHGQFVTQRTLPQMALFLPKMTENILNITYGDQKFSFDMDERSHQVISTRVWDDAATTMKVSEAADQWFSDMLRQKITLVRIKDEMSRMHHNKTQNIHLPVSLADGYPYLLIGEESLRHLNTRVQTPLAMDRFRPNIVVTSTVPHEEDAWTSMTINGTKFLNMKPCGRCNVITIDQATAEINNEPLRILNQYRKVGNSVLFGTNLMCAEEGIVSIGDKILM